MSLIVFGSINLDLVTKTPRLPLPGESLTGHNFFTAFGGKGANQAVMAARLGMTTYMVGRVGNDSFGQELLGSLQESGVICDRVFVDPSTHSGVAVITVEDSGENTIILVPGANGQVNQTDVEQINPLFDEAFALLLQLEIPLPAVKAAAENARKAGVKVILDPAPAQVNVPADFYPLVDIITPNETEASLLVGFPVNSPETAAKAAQELQRRGVEIVLVTLGAKGVFCATKDEDFFLPAFPVEAIDTVAAGDAFNGAIATALATGKSLREAVIWGAAAGALATTKVGAQSSLCDRATLEKFLAEHPVNIL
jgi:ribokinase